MSPTSDRWKPVSSLIAQVFHGLRRTCASVTDAHQPQFFDGVDVHQRLGVELYSAILTDTHSDDGFPEWSALLILQASEHSLVTRFAEDGEPLDISPLAAGDIVVFRIAELHALELPEALFEGRDPEANDADLAWMVANHLLIAAHVDFDMALVPGALPPRAHVETLLEEVLRPALLPTLRRAA